eukprot:5194464-Pyramimonas_sp.AAC.1
METSHVPLFSTDDGDPYGLDSDEATCQGSPVRATALLDLDRVTTMRVYATAAAKRAAVILEDDLLAKADVQANPVK